MQPKLRTSLAPLQFWIVALSVHTGYMIPFIRTSRDQAKPKRRGAIFYNSLNETWTDGAGGSTDARGRSQFSEARDLPSIGNKGSPTECFPLSEEQFSPHPPEPFRVRRYLLHGVWLAQTLEPHTRSCSLLDIRQPSATMSPSATLEPDVLLDNSFVSFFSL